MSRFNNLEFGDSLGDGQEQNPVLKDENYYLNEAHRFYEQGDFEQGLRAYSKVLEYNPENSVAWTAQVKMLIELGEFREAKVWADKALERFPHEPELLAAKGVALCRMGDLKTAMAFSDAAIEERGDTAYVWIARGDVQLARREKHADFCFNKAMERAGRSWFVPWLISRVYSHYLKFALALQTIQKALEWDAGQAVVWFQAGRCQQAMGLVGHAEYSYEQAAQLNPRLMALQEARRQLQETDFWTRWRGWWRSTFNS
ncbi:MAG: tetratricopeptide repeat protein [Verrucomicrobiae bacterium]|nr:tetratricopeptide repeat protein [Verrucomicrobiae bacterium]